MGTELISLGLTDCWRAVELRFTEEMAAKKWGPRKGTLDYLACSH